MADAQPESVQPDVALAPVWQAPSTRYPTWRFMGERSAADRAYCTRFGVEHAPEPSTAGNEVWAYTLPGFDARA